MSAGWVVVVDWDRFQHYRNRAPRWVKLYTDLQHDDDWRALTGNDRAVLVGIWLEYASSGCRLHADTRSLSARLALRVTTGTLERLTAAGFITVSASRPLAPRYQDASLEGEGEKERPSQGTTGGRASVPCPLDPGCIVTPGELYQHLRTIHVLDHDTAAAHAGSEGA